jgi:cobalamin biosynthesis Mg chelatase CobN
VLALLALVAFPVFAHAAGIPEYELEEGGTHIHRESVKPKPNEGQSQEKETQKPAHGSVADEPDSSGEPSEEEESSQGGTAGGTSNGGNTSGGESGKSGNGKPAGAAEAEGKIGPGKEVAAGGPSEATATPVSSQSTSSGGSSSPVVPILIAVVFLAAISIGVVIYRQRKGGTGQDGRVSSSNAS